MTELWFAVKEALEAGQIRGFTQSAKSQGCCRLYEMKGKKYSVEPKAEMKMRLRYSPDEMDAISGLVHVAKQNGFVIEGKIAQVAAKEWNDSVNDVSSKFKSQEPQDKSDGWADVPDVQGAPAWA